MLFEADSPSSGFPAAASAIVSSRHFRSRSNRPRRKTSSRGRTLSRPPPRSIRLQDGGAHAPYGRSALPRLSRLQDGAPRAPYGKMAAGSSQHSARAPSGKMAAAAPQQLVQYVVLRGDLRWPRGALVAQACHAALAVLHAHYAHPDSAAYLAERGRMRTVVLEVRRGAGHAGKGPPSPEGWGGVGWDGDGEGGAAPSGGWGRPGDRGSPLPSASPAAGSVSFPQSRRGIGRHLSQSLPRLRGASTLLIGQKPLRPKGINLSEQQRRHFRA